MRIQPAVIPLGLPLILLCALSPARAQEQCECPSVSTNYSSCNGIPFYCPECAGPANCTACADNRDRICGQDLIECAGPAGSCIDQIRPSSSSLPKSKLLVASGCPVTKAAATAHASSPAVKLKGKHSKRASHGPVASSSSGS